MRRLGWELGLKSVFGEESGLRVNDGIKFWGQMSGKHTIESRRHGGDAARVKLLYVLQFVLLP